MLLPLLALLATQGPAPAHFKKLAHTYSIVAFDSVSGDLGVIVQSKFPNVGGIVPWARAGVAPRTTMSATIERCMVRGPTSSRSAPS